MSKVCLLCTEQQRLGDPQADKVRASSSCLSRKILILVGPSYGFSRVHPIRFFFQMRMRKITPKVLQLLTEWTETFPYDFRDERMMRSLKELTQRLASGDEVRTDSLISPHCTPIIDPTFSINSLYARVDKGPADETFAVITGALFLPAAHAVKLQARADFFCADRVGGRSGRKSGNKAGFWGQLSWEKSPIVCALCGFFFARHCGTLFSASIWIVAQLQGWKSPA